MCGIALCLPAGAPPNLSSHQNCQARDVRLIASGFTNEEYECPAGSTLEAAGETHVSHSQVCTCHCSTTVGQENKQPDRLQCQDVHKGNALPAEMGPQVWLADILSIPWDTAACTPALQGVLHLSQRDTKA